MSSRILVIPEDPTQNGYLLRPLIERICSAAGRPNAKVKILTNPRTRGYDSAVLAMETSLIQAYRHFDLWLFVADTDRARGLDELESRLAKQRVNLICVAAQPELEAWLLAGYARELPLPWNRVREHPRLKEEVFGPFLQRHGNPSKAGQGREDLMRQVLKSYDAIKGRCPEIDSLEERFMSFFKLSDKTTPHL